MGRIQRVSLLFLLELVCLYSLTNPLRPNLFLHPKPRNHRQGSGEPLRTHGEPQSSPEAPSPGPPSSSPELIPPSQSCVVPSVKIPNSKPLRLDSHPPLASFRHHHKTRPKIKRHIASSLLGTFRHHHPALHDSRRLLPKPRPLARPQPSSPLAVSRTQGHQPLRLDEGGALLALLCRHCRKVPRRPSGQMDAPFVREETFEHGPVWPMPT